MNDKKCVYFVEGSCEKQLIDALNKQQPYIEEVVHGRKKWNLKSLKEFSFSKEIRIMFRTVAVILRKKICR